MGAVAENYGRNSFSAELEKDGAAPVAFNVPTSAQIKLANTSSVPGVLAPEVTDLRMPSQGIQPPAPRVAYDPDDENAPRQDTNPRLARLMTPTGPAGMA